MERTGDGREDVPADRRAVEGEVADGGEAQVVAENRRRRLGRLGPRRFVEVRRERHEALDAERRQILPRHPRVALDENDGPPALELKPFREHPLELQLVDELRQADEEGGRPVAVADGAETGVVAPQPRDVALEDRTPPDAVGESRERRHAAGTASAK